ncbi:MAG: 2-succinyl-6-hydroxy-2,4-cyclohexadiene-1-carboxylate synthase [Acidimicrobiales bacterium]|nr:MAG: alpha/beta hydrolase [Actinomycetota bacterium]MBV6509383.1 2-succinyl-6-hydroxy-2,4-cyclohexadiene-1-carboxylate synthase [Acidimicrobiales bacterium]RIK04585.1 MAG: alpha/beta hydrolase [Acidobacteriota bacterium]
MNTPDWFKEAVAAPYEEDLVTVEGCDIHYLVRGGRGRAGLVFVHGGAAHARWWDHIAPMLATEYQVVAVDLSGHGDSGRRDTYPTETWAQEVMAVAEHSGIDGPPIVVAHSMGGWVAISAAAEQPETLAGIVVLDSPVRVAAPEEEAAAEGIAFGPLRTYPTMEDALSRFRTVPDQPTSLPYVIDHVARTSLRQVEDGWTWKFDPRIFTFRVPSGEQLRQIRCRVALFRSEYGLVTPDIGEYMYEQLGRIAPVIEVPLAWHHVMLDQPLPLTTGLRTLLADWEHSVPYRRK